MSGFPVDDATLILLAEACRINPDNGRSNLLAFLDMGARIQAVTTEDGQAYDTLEEAAEATYDGAVLFVEHVPGFEPHSPQSVILALVEEIQRQRGQAA